MANDSKPFPGLLNLNLAEKVKQNWVAILEAERISRVMDDIWASVIPNITFKVQGLTIAEGLHALCESLNDQHKRGGKAEAARLLGWHYSTVWRKLTGRSPITESDALSIQRAVGMAEV